MLAGRLEGFGADAVFVLADGFPVFRLNIVINFDVLGFEGIEAGLAAGGDPVPVAAADFVVIGFVAAVGVWLIRLATVVDVARELGLGDSTDAGLHFCFCAFAFNVHDSTIHQLSPQEGAVH